MPRRRRARQYIFYFHKRLTEFRLAEMEAFIHHSRSAMHAAWQKFGRDFDAKTAGWDQADIDLHVDGIIDEIAMLRDASPQMIRQTHCIMLYSTFEHALADAKGYLRPHNIPAHGRGG